MAMTEATPPPSTDFDGPRLIFSSELGGPAILALLRQPGVLVALAARRCGVAMALLDFSSDRAEAVRLLSTHQIYTVAWLMPPTGKGFWFNLQNYPQAQDRYHAFQAWVAAEQLQFDAIGLDIEPPLIEVEREAKWGLQYLVIRLWQANENALYAAAHSAYSDLIAEIHTAPYEVHAYQLPLLADDRRAGTTLLQRALDVVEVPADVEVLTCYSSLPPNRLLGSDLGGALIASYANAADSVAVGLTGSGVRDEVGIEITAPLSWEALERDLLLAAHYADIVYISSLEGCVARGLLPRIFAIDWEAEARPVRSRRLLVALLRGVLLMLLLFGRFSRSLLAWSGWVLAGLLLLRQFRRWWQTRK